MALSRILIANRGEIAIRIARAAAECGAASVAVFPSDDAAALHVVTADQAVALPGTGVRAYLDGAALIAAALGAGCDAVHPGYGFLSENAGFARACAAAGLVFIGPAPAALDLFGDKVLARDLAIRLGIPVPAGSDGPVDLARARDCLAAFGTVMIKAVAGGGGRGMRAVLDPAGLDAAYAACRAEAGAAFGVDSVYVERLIRRARHVEVQIIGDGADVMVLGDRDCSLQRRHQKLLEIAPAPGLSDRLRRKLAEAALGLAQAVPYCGLLTVEFLIDLDADDSFVFIEANPRIQVEHTVTEAVTGLDLASAQIALAGGARLADLGLDPAAAPLPRGFAIQARINAETMMPDGSARPAAGTLRAFEPPGGPGRRIDTAAYAGYTVNPAYDSLLAKLIVTAGSYAEALRRTARALDEFHLAGIASNLGFLRNLVAAPALASGEVDTGFIERHAAALTQAAPSRRDLWRADGSAVPAGPVASAAPAGAVAITAPMAGVLAAFSVAPGDPIWIGRPVAILEAMKMEHVVLADRAGIVIGLPVEVRAPIGEGADLLYLDPAEIAPDLADAAAEVDLDTIRPDLAELLARQALTQDASRPEATAKRHAGGHRMARENIADLCDPGSFTEYGALAMAAQRGRRPIADLMRATPADGIITGFGAVNGAHFAPEAARTAVLAYDFTVLAGTQGYFSHRKTDRLLDQAREWSTPVVIYAEGGGGRPGDTDIPIVAGLDTPSFASFAALSGAVPLVGIAAGRCFAGNAALLGCCDVIIATSSSNIGMSGPAMIEGGGLGIVAPEDIGPIAVQRRNGVVDIAVADEAEATAAAKRYLGFFQGMTAGGNAADQRLLRALVPENRLRGYDMRRLIEILVDADSGLELRRDFGRAVITTLARIDGRPLGILANNPGHLSGAIDGDAADKAARFLRLCEAHGLPVLSLIDTPGFMVGPEVEAQAQVRRVCRLFLAGARLSVPFISVVIRKGYGLGAQGMAAGSFHQPLLNLAWPSGEFGGMGIEGAVTLGYRKELAAIADPDARAARFRDLVAKLYADGKAINMAAMLEIDGVIDPAETRALVARTLAGLPARRRRADALPFIDTW